MAKVTGKLQITLPKAVAERCGIRVGDDLVVRAAGTSIHIERVTATERTTGDRLAHFDAATLRQRARRWALPRRTRGRGWTREDLYVRDRHR